MDVDVEGLRFELLRLHATFFGALLDELAGNPTESVFGPPGPASFAYRITARDVCLRLLTRPWNVVPIGIDPEGLDFASPLLSVAFASGAPTPGAEGPKPGCYVIRCDTLAVALALPRWHTRVVCGTGSSLETLHWHRLAVTITGQPVLDPVEADRFVLMAAISFL